MSGFIPMVSSSPPPMDEGGGFDWDEDGDEFGTFTGADENNGFQEKFSHHEKDSKTSIPDDTVSDWNQSNGSNQCNSDNNTFADFATFSTDPNGNIDEDSEITNSFFDLSDVRPNTIELIKDACNTAVLSDDKVSSNKSLKETGHDSNGTLTDSGLYSSDVSPVPQYDDVALKEKAQGDSDSLEEFPADLPSGQDQLSSKTSDVDCSEETATESKSVSGEIERDDSETSELTDSHLVSGDTCEVNVSKDGFSHVTDVKIESDENDQLSEQNCRVDNSPVNAIGETKEDLAGDSSYAAEDNSQSNIPSNNTCHSSAVHTTTVTDDSGNLAIDTFESIDNAIEDSSILSNDKDKCNTSSAFSTTLEVDKHKNWQKVEDVNEKDLCMSDSGILSNPERINDQIDDTYSDIFNENNTSCDSNISKNNELPMDKSSEVESDIKLQDSIADSIPEDSEINYTEKYENSKEKIQFENLKADLKTESLKANSDDDVTNLEINKENSEPSPTEVNKIGDRLENKDGVTEASLDSSTDKHVIDDEMTFKGFCEAEKTTEAGLEAFSEKNDFGDFSGTPEDDFNNFSDNDDEFGDFNASGFASFNDSVQPETASGQSDDWAAFSETQTVAASNSVVEDEDDEWAAFGDETVETTSPSVVSSVEDESENISQTKMQSMNKHEKIIYAVTTCFPTSSSSTTGDIEANVQITDINTLIAVGSNADSESSVWCHIKGLKSTNSLTYQWTKSKWNNQLFTTLHIDTRNVLIGHKKASMPIFASGLTMLEPTKGAGGAASNTLQPDILVDTSKSDPIPTLSQETIPPAQFDWGGSGLTNPLEASNKTLNLDFLIQDTTATKSSVLESEFLATNESPVHKPTIQPLENILANLKSAPTFKPTSQNEDISEEAGRIVHSLPNLLFMKSKVLIFPLKMDN